MKNFTQISNPLLKPNQLSIPARLLYCILRGYCRKDYYFCYPGQKRLAQELGYTTDRSIRKYLKELELAKIIKPFPRGIGRTNTYYVDPNLELFERNGVSYVTGKHLPTNIGMELPTNNTYRKNTKVNNTKLSQLKIDRKKLAESKSIRAP